MRPGTIDDLPFIDRLQKVHGQMVGWMPRQQLEGKIGAGQVLVAWAARPCSSDADKDTGEPPVPLGYCIGHDQYFKRDDVGIIYQMNVVPAKQRGLVGATLVTAMFDRAAYGCRLFCCWCAQDIEANYFWESLGFIPLAFRAGSRGKQRVHIFWQRRIRAGDTTTPYWFPAQTSSGSIREDRVVLPIPPGTHWRDAKPLLLPWAENPRLESRATKGRTPKTKTPAIPPTSIVAGGLRFSSPNPAPSNEKAKREAKQKVKNDPKLVAAARELRDRWLERVNAHPEALPSQGKYDVARALPSRESIATGAVVNAVPALPVPLAA